MQVRYLAFAQVGLFALWGVVAASLPTRTERILLAGLIVGLALAGLARAEHLYPDGEHAALAAMRFVRERHQNGDLILVSCPAEVNRTRHTAHRLGFEQVDVRCRWSAFDGPGHALHVASLRSSEIIREGGERRRTECAPRLWLISADEGFAHGARAGMRCVVQRTFRGSEDSQVTLALYVRDEPRTAE